VNLSSINQSQEALEVRFNAIALFHKLRGIPARDIDAELTTLMRQREVVQKALTIQQGRLDEAVRVTSSAEYRRFKPRYIAEIKKMVSGVETIEAALNGMQSIKNEMTTAGLRDIFPYAGWPGLHQGDFQRQRESFQVYLGQMGLSDPK
jgi:hypothetical protein